MAKPTTIDEYIAAAPEAGRPHLRELRALLRQVAPDAREAIKWGEPVFEEGRILFAISAYRSYARFMPTRGTIDAFPAELAGWSTGRDTVQLPYDRPIPADLIRLLAEHRLRDVRENGALWMGRG